MNLLVDARNGREEVRPHLLERATQVADDGTEGERETGPRSGEMDKPAEAVRKREKQHDPITRSHQVNAADHVGHGDEVAIGQHAALRRTRRAGGVDAGENIILADQRGRLSDGVREPVAMGATSLRQIVEIVEAHDVLEAR